MNVSQPRSYLDGMDDYLLKINNMNNNNMNLEDQSEEYIVRALTSRR